MLRKVVLFLVIFGLGGMLFKSLYRGYAEAYVQEINIPLSNTLSASFKTKLNTQYKVVIALKPSEGLQKTNGLIDGGDAYERSENLGRYVLEGVKLEVDGLTNPDIKLKETFSIFGGAPAYENTTLEWEPHASYLLANFQGTAGNQYRITVSQKKIASSQNKPSVPAYLMVREANGWTHYTMYIVVLISLLIPVMVVIFKSTIYIFKAICRLFSRLLTHHSSGTG